MDIGHPIRRRIIVPRLPERGRVEPSPNDRPIEPRRVMPVNEREAETV